MGDSYRALRGGNYRENGAVAVAGETYDDVPEVLVEDLIARRAIVAAEMPVVVPLADRPMAELTARAETLELEVVGSGSGGRVTKDDVVRALQNAGEN